MSDIVDNVASEIAADISAAIEDAAVAQQESEVVAEQIAAAAMESERGRRLDSFERDLGECLSNQAALSEAVTAMALELQKQQGQLSTLVQLNQSPTLAESEGEDGQRESQEIEIVEVEAPPVEITPPVESVPPVPRKKRRWI